MPVQFFPVQVYFIWLALPIQLARDLIFLRRDQILFPTALLVAIMQSKVNAGTRRYFGATLQLTPSKSGKKATFRMQPS